MGWNDPDKDNDPQRNKNQPPDLDEALKRLQRKLKHLFSGLFTPSAGKPVRMSASAPPPDANSNLPAGMLIILFSISALILWALSGIFIVNPAEQAVILRFGKYVRTVGSGPHWIPRLIETKMVQNMDRVSDYSYSGQMLTKDENLVAVSLAVQYRIGDLEAYFFNATDPEESLRQATSSALRQVVGTTTLDQMITEGREAWGSSVQDSLIKILDQYKTGIVIVNVSPQPARAPENVQDAFDDAIKAQEDEKRFKEQAYAYQARVVPIAEGNSKRIMEEAQAFAQQVVLRAKGDVAEFLALLPDYTQSPEVTGKRMYLDTMQKVLSQSSKIILEGKAGNMLYLPIDKLNASTGPSMPRSLESSGGKEGQLMLNTDRETMRSANRPERNE